MKLEKGIVFLSAFLSGALFGEAMMDLLTGNGAPVELKLLYAVILALVAWGLTGRATER